MRRPPPSCTRADTLCPVTSLLRSIGVVGRDVMRQSDGSYVIVYDNAGAVIHDGSSDISTYGQAMQDPLAFEAVAARDVHMQVQMEERLMDVSAPIRIG